MGPFELDGFHRARRQSGNDANRSTRVPKRRGSRRRTCSATWLRRGCSGARAAAGFYDYADGQRPERLDLARTAAGAAPPNDEESVALVGFGGLADELAELLEQRYAQRPAHRERRVARRALARRDDRDRRRRRRRRSRRGHRATRRTSGRGDGVLRRRVCDGSRRHARGGCASRTSGRLRHPRVARRANCRRDRRFAKTSPTTRSELAQELFASLGKGVVLVEDVPGTVSRAHGRFDRQRSDRRRRTTDVASPDDVDAAMRLGTNYPIGPIAWGREIGGDRVARILQRLADAEGAAVRAAPLALGARRRRRDRDGCRRRRACRMSSRGRWVVDAVRTPIGRYGGALASVRPDDLAAIVAARRRRAHAASPRDRIDDVYFGAANQSGEDNRNVARMAALLAGLAGRGSGRRRSTVCADRACRRSTPRRKRSRSARATSSIAGGVESMTRAPYVLPKSETPFGARQQIFDTVLGWRMINPEDAARVDDLAGRDRRERRRAVRHHARRARPLRV